jgi:hypothetical protein
MSHQANDERWHKGERPEERSRTCTKQPGVPEEKERKNGYHCAHDPDRDGEKVDAGK